MIAASKLLRKLIMIEDIFGGWRTSEGEATRLPARLRTRLAVTAIQGKGNAYTLAVVTADLEPIRAPAGIRLIDHDAAIMAPFDTGTGMALQ